MNTTDYFGHEAIRQALSGSLPAVSLFLGPESVGKWELAEHLRNLHGVQSSDVLRIKRLTQDNAKFVARFALGAPQGEYRLVIVRMENATSVAMNTLLKTLEESASTKFILVATEPPLDTIVSRAEVFEFGLLTDENVRDILVHVKRIHPEVAEKRALLSNGTLDKALYPTNTSDRKTLVLRALAAITSKDHRALDPIAKHWQEEHTDLLVTWCHESLSGRWKIFNEAESNIRGTALPLKLLVALRSEVRPRLVVRWAIASLM